MPFRTTISKNLEDKYEKLKEIFFNKIESIEYFGITLDIWTNKYTNTAFLCVTCHFIEEDESDSTLVLENYVLKNIEMKENKTGLKIREKLVEILQEMKCFRAENTYVSDNGPNIVKALEVYSRISCSGHNLNLVSKHSIESVQNIKKFIDTIKSIISKLKKNGIMKKLEIFIPQSCDTRFNSIYSMLNSFEKNFEKLTEFARKNKEDKILTKLISIDKKLLTSYIKILALFNDATLELSYNESPTIQKVIPIKISLEDMCEIEENELEDIITFKSNLKKYLKQYMKISDVHKIAILLDPKKRSLKMMKNATEKEYMKQLLFSEMKKYDSDENSQIQSLTSSKKRKYKTLSDKYNDDSDTEEEDIYDQSKSTIEFEKYFKLKI
jgi:hypothetical protein